MCPEPPTRTDPLLAKMKAIEASAVERSKQRRAQGNLPLDSEAPITAAKVVKLPLWPDAVRAVPNGFLRSALFGAIRRGPRRYMKREQIAALEGIEIYYTGERLDQSDLNLWEMILHIARLQGLGNECRVTAYQLLKALGKTDTGKNREILDIRLSRMKATGVDVHIGRFGYEGSLIDEVYRDKETREYVFRANPKLRTLFEPDQFTQVDWAVRRELDGQPLAQWLHGFYASHAQPYPISIAKLHELSGSEASEHWKFAQTLRKNLDSLAKASAMHGQPFRYSIQNDVVHADKIPSRSQQHHLTKKPVKSITKKI